jgi:hypothetical protein
MTIIMYDNHKDLNSLDIEKINSAAICNPASNADNVIFRLPLSYDDICTAFTRCNLLPKTEDTIIASQIDRKITSQSFLALSYTYFGVKHNDKHITQNGLRQYGRSLSVLNNALTKDDAALSLDVLEAIMVMALIEACSSLSLQIDKFDLKQFLISDRENGWIRHSRGLERLFDIRGPKSMMSLPCLMVLEKTRASIIFAAIVLQKPTIFTRPEWKTDPWLLHPERIDSGKLLCDILTDCPELFELRIQLLKEPCGMKKQADIRSLTQKCHGILARLEQWGDDWAIDISKVCIEVPAPSTTPRAPDTDGRFAPVWSTILQFDSLDQSNSVTMYNGALILVLQFLQGLILMEKGHKSQALQSRIHDAGMIICRSVEYHYRQSWGERGGFFLLFPLRMAHSAVGRDNAVIDLWLKGILNEIATGRRGLWKSAKSLLEIMA